MTLVDAVRGGNTGMAERLLQGGANVHELDANGWTALNWAAGSGDIPMMRLLLQFGASPSLTGKDQRTPAMIALAAGKRDAAVFLQERADKDSSAALERKYCMAFHLKELRQFSGWEDVAANRAVESTLPDASLVYLHSNYVVTRSAWVEDEALADKVSAEWIQFCQLKLMFRSPSDIDQISG